MCLKNGNDLNSTLMSKSLFKLLIDRNNVFQIQNCSILQNTSTGIFKESRTNYMYQKLKAPVLYNVILYCVKYHTSGVN